MHLTRSSYRISLKPASEGNVCAACNIHPKGKPISCTLVLTPHKMKQSGLFPTRGKGSSACLLKSNPPAMQSTVIYLFIFHPTPLQHAEKRLASALATGRKEEGNPPHTGPVPMHESQRWLDRKEWESMWQLWRIRMRRLQFHTRGQQRTPENWVWIFFFKTKVCGLLGVFLKLSITSLPEFFHCPVKWDQFGKNLERPLLDQSNGPSSTEASCKQHTSTTALSCDSQRLAHLMPC